MCGIAGLVGSTDPGRAQADVRAITRALRHRGPDAEGFYDGPCASLGHRRLSILDTDERANQPMRAPDADGILVFNGEIYNFRQLRGRLETEGERFQTTGDTEVLLRLLARSGVEALGQLQGMFALGFWRPDRRELLLARDRFGEKPLFYAPVGKGLAFASEVGALLVCTDIERRLDLEALGCYLETGFVPAPLTMLASVASLEPGQWLRWHEGKVTTGYYHRWSVAPDPALSDPDAAAAAVHDALRNAVRRQMVSDVPLGAFLSGGIDSSSVVAMMQAASSRPVKTFSVRFEATQYDESAIARRVADHLGTEHHELTVHDASFHEDDLWRIVEHVGVPFHDSSAIPTYVVSRYAREHVTVALSGDGGDEMFAGYPVFEWGRRVNQLAAAPRPLLRIAAAALGVAGHLRQLRKALEVAQLDAESARFRAIHRLFAPGEIRALLTLDAVDAAARNADRLTALPPAAQRWTPLRRMMYSRIRNELANDMLVKVDRMSMAASLEVRAPFLDVEVAAVSMRLPDAHLIRRGIGKQVLREAMRPYLPAEVFTHPKWGFSVPLHTFVNDDFRDLSRGLLGDRGPLDGVLAPAAVRRFVQRGLSADRDRGEVSVYQATHQLWALLQLSAWMQRFGVRA